jgi:ketosteroid isomerase-like protein
MQTKVWRVVPLAVLLVSSLLGCKVALAAPQPDRAALEAAIQRWMSAVNAQDVAGLTATLTEDVELLDANAATVAGRDAVVRALREAATRGTLVATNREITIAQDVAWRVAGFAQTQKNGDVQARGQALEIWRRVDGEWKLHRQMAAGVITPRDLLTRPPADEPVVDRQKN